MKKYAVYQSETGYYYYEYCDSLEQLKDTPFEAMVNAEQLPVVLDGAGGYFHFNPNDFNFDRLIESDEKYPLPVEQCFFKNSDQFKLGWMSPDGDTYSCNFTNHLKCASMLAEINFSATRLPETVLGNAGWIKIIDSWNGVERQHGQFVYSLNGTLTKRQADKLFDLGLYYNPEVQKMISYSEAEW